MSRPWTRPASAAVILIVLVAAAAGASTRFLRAAVDPVHIVLNDMTRAAGQLRDGVLTVEIEAREGDWYADGADGAALRVAAFAEAGRPLQNPGPLLRAPSGTEVRATVRNTLSKPLTVYGLGRERGIDADSALIEPGAAHEFRFTLGEPGVHYYVGRTEDVPAVMQRFEYDSQLNGALVIDPPGARGRPRDRLLMITGWATLDSTTVSGLGPNATLAINGAMWPHTEKFDVTQDDSLHWRWINATDIPHPMHLHGFYFRTDARGDGATYSAVPTDERHLAVTELLMPGHVIEVAWSPDRPGNWIFHCHFAGHMASHAALDQDRRHPHTIAAAAAVHAGHPVVSADGANGANGTHGAVNGDAGGHVEAVHAQHGMSGLVLGIRVRPRGRQPVAAAEARSIRLLLRSQPEIYGEYTGYGFVLGGSPAERDPAALTVPGPLLVLRQDEPVAITLVNQTHEAGAVHWHGIELESFPDGVPGWSGYRKQLLPTIPPRDSLTVRFTPPRAGTFMYHSHFNELQQIGSGMYGAIVVLEPGREYDADTDRVLLFSDGGPIVNLIEGPFPPVLLNGAAEPPDLELRTGQRYRFRLINILSEGIVVVSLRDGDEPVSWELVAKDGADLPAQQIRDTPATLTFASGEIYDAEFVPQRSGTLTLRFGGPAFPGAPPPVAVAVQVR